MTQRRDEPADRLRIVFVPAARIDDPVTSRVAGEGEFLLRIERPEGTKVAQSATTMSWDQAVARASVLTGASEADAVRRWARMGLDGSAG